MGQDEIHHNASLEAEESVPEKTQYRDADKALDFLRHNENGDEHTLVDEKKLVKRIDWMIVPIMFCCYFLQYLDKSLRMFTLLLKDLKDRIC